MLKYGLSFNHWSAKEFSPAIFETYFSYERDKWIAVTDYCICFYLIGLFSLIAVLQLINLQHHNF